MTKAISQTASPEFYSAVNALVNYRKKNRDPSDGQYPSYGQYGLQLVFKCFASSRKPVKRQDLVAVGIAAGYTKAAVSGAICVAKKHGHLKSVKCHGQPVYYQVTPDFMNSSFRIYKRASRRSRRAGKFYAPII